MSNVVAEQGGQEVSMFERFARDPSIDVAKLRELMQMQREIRREQAEVLFNSAMADCQAQMKRVTANKRNTQTNSDYADYAALDRMVRPIYSEAGFALSFDTGDAPSPDLVRVLCYVTHRGGFARTYKQDMPADGKGAKGGDVMTKTHATGSAMQYGMRYLLKGIFNLAIGKDDDGNAAGKPVITADQVKALLALIKDVGADKSLLLKYLKVGKLEELPAQAYDHAVSALEKKRKTPAATGSAPTYPELAARAHAAKTDDEKAQVLSDSAHLPKPQQNEIASAMGLKK